MGVMGERAEAIRARLEVTWGPFRAAVADRLDQPTPAGWTAKEMLAHVAFWDEAVVPVVVTMLRGQQLPPGSSFGSGDFGLAGDEWPVRDVHNAREAVWARSRPAAEVLERADRAYPARAPHQRHSRSMKTTSLPSCMVWPPAISW